MPLWTATYQHDPDLVDQPITDIHTETFSAPGRLEAVEAAKRFAAASPDLVSGANYVILGDPDGTILAGAYL